MSDSKKSLLQILQKSVDSNEDKEKILRLLEGLASSSYQSDYDPNGEKKVEPLKELFHKFNEKHQFKPGDIVKWKNSLKNRKRPRYGEPAIVLRFDSQPKLYIEDKGPETPYFKEPLDLVLGLLDEDGDFDIYHFDSRRFEPFE